MAILGGWCEELLAVRFYIFLLPAFFVAVWILTLRGVIVRASKGQVSSVGSPADCVSQYAQPQYVMLVLIVVRVVISFGPVSKLLAKLGMPAEDAVSLGQQNVWFRLLPALLYTAAWLFSYAHAFLMQNLLSFYSYFGRLFHCLPEALLNKVSILHLLFSITAVLSTFICGSLGVLISFVLLLFRVIHIYYTISLKLDTKETHLRLSFFFCLLMILCWTSLLSLAGLAVWVKQISISHQVLQPIRDDPTFLPGLILSICVTALLRADNSLFERPPSEMLGWLLYLLSLLVLLFAMESIYRLPIFAAVLFIVATGQRVFSAVSRNSNTKDD